MSGIYRNGVLCRIRSHGGAGKTGGPVRRYFPRDYDGSCRRHSEGCDYWPGAAERFCGQPVYDCGGGDLGGRVPRGASGKGLL